MSVYSVVQEGIVLVLFVLALCVVRYDNNILLSFCTARDMHFSALVCLSVCL